MKHLSKGILLVVLVCSMSMASTCSAEPNFAKEANTVKSKDIHGVMRKEQVVDARYPTLKKHDSLAFPIELQHQLKQILKMNDLGEQKLGLIKVLERADGAGKVALEIEWKRLSENLRKQHQALYDNYLEHHQGKLNSMVDEVRALSSQSKVRQYIKHMQTNIRDYHKEKTGETGRKFFSIFAKPFVEGWKAYHVATDDRSAHIVQWAQANVYQFTENRNTLLEKFAPIIVVQKSENPAYAPATDEIGEVRLEGQELKSAVPMVETRKPTVYSYQDQKRVLGSDLTQLVYVIWFPEHPPIKGEGDPEAGILEGWTLRITLNVQNKPLLFESVSNCGCYYKVFPTAALEAAAGTTFGNALEGKQFVLENEVHSKIDVTMPELVDLSGSQTGRVALYYEAGSHQLMTIRPDYDYDSVLSKKQVMGYRLSSYDELEHLSFEGHEASLFEPSSLVRKAHRAECSLLEPTGMYHAGHPRQRSTQLIYFDQFAFDDPDLFETYLRIPPSALESAGD